MLDVVSPFRVVIADDHPAMRLALTELLGGHPRLHVVGVAADAEEAIDVCTSHRPDIALLDAAMPQGGGARAASVISERLPATTVICLTAYTDERTRLEMLRSGAAAVLHKGSGEDIAERLLELCATR
ncbi:MAG: response regulator transcription factor [Acidimicrobiales bacterium]